MKRLYRIADVNINRSFEGLRVCEDVTRFVLKDRALSSKFKGLRKLLLEAVRSAGEYGDFVKSRDSVNDLGRDPSYDLSGRSGAEDLFFANCQRAKAFSRWISRPVVASSVSNWAKPSSRNAFACSKWRRAWLKAPRQAVAFTRNRSA